MSTVQEIKDAHCQLAPAEPAAFRACFAEFDADRWDAQLEEDIAAGPLEGLAAEVLLDYRDGCFTHL